MSHVTLLLFLASSFFVCRDVQPGDPASTLPPGAFEPARLAAALDERVHYDHDEHGALWARGSRWKMSFDGRKAVYYPLLGPRQVEHCPLSLSPVSVKVGEHVIPFLPQAQPKRVEDRVELDRGTFVEAYELRPDALEQLFVFPVVPQGGDLVLRIPTGSTLEREEGEDGLQFRSELGGVRYSRAVAIDARGERSSAITRFLGSTIEIRVDAEYLLTAEAPLVIDPVVSRWSVDTSSYKDYNPDVAYDASTNRWLIVWERNDGGDLDVAYELVEDHGFAVAAGYINSDGTGWSRPKCASNNAFDTFLTVANAMISGGWKIQGRIMSAWDGLPGATYTFSDGQPGEYCYNPDVGGDPRTVWYSTYCVVFERLKNNGDTGIYYRRAVGTGGPVETFSYVFAPSIYPEVMPSISKSNDGREWAVAYDRNNGSIDQVYAGRIDVDGIISGYPYSIMNTTGDGLGPKVSTMLNNSTRFLVASASMVDGQWDVMLTAMDGYTKLTEANLGALEFGGPLNYATQDQPCVDSNGARFFVAYREFVNNDKNVFGSALALSGSTLSVVENRVNIRVTTGNDEFSPTIASKEGAGGTGKRMMLAWTDFWKYGSNWNVWAALYDLP